MGKIVFEVIATVPNASVSKTAVSKGAIPGAVKKMPAEKQAEPYDKMTDRQLQRAAQTRDRVEIRSAPVSQPNKMTQMRYADIDASAPVQETQAGTPSSVLSVSSGSSVSLDSLGEEIKKLKQRIDEMREMSDKSPSSSLDHPVFKTAFDQLVVNGVDRRLAYHLIKKAAFEWHPSEVHSDEVSIEESVQDLLASELISGVQSRSFFRELKQSKEVPSPALVAWIGPTGVGKTTTLAKIASEAMLRRGMKVGLVHIEHRPEQRSTASFGQLGTYARILNVPFRSVASIEDFKSALGDFQGLDLILIDTVGCSQKDTDSIKEIQKILASGASIDPILVLSATTRDSELQEITARFSVLKPKGIVFSKLDEAILYGCIYNVAIKSKLPLYYFTTGQKIPDDIEEASGERVAALVMEIE